MKRQGYGKRKTLAVKNTSTETVPAFGLMRIDLDAPSTANGGQLIWNIVKPDMISQAGQDPTIHCLNGPIDIAAGEYGVASRDYPVRASLNRGTYADGADLGAMDDSWLLHTGFEMYRLMCNDPLEDQGDTDIGWVCEIADGSLFWCMLQEDHPGRGVEFDILVGRHCPDTGKHRFDCSETVFQVGIDWHNGAPEPDEYTQGWFKRRPSTTTDSGYIFHVISLDCESDDSCTDHQLTDGECP